MEFSRSLKLAKRLTKVIKNSAIGPDDSASVKAPLAPASYSDFAFGVPYDNVAQHFFIVSS
jgi:hypothetical protein